MKDHIEIEVVANTSLVSNLHETVASILNQRNINTLNMRLRFVNRAGLNLNTEKTLIRNAGIKIIEQPSDARFLLTINSGHIVSPSFLYKGIHFLLKNSAAFVCPEYTFRRFDNSPIVATVANDHMLYDGLSIRLIDRQKLSEINSSPRASIVKDTCAALDTLDQDFRKYIKNFKHSRPFLTSPLYLSSASVINQDQYCRRPNMRHKIASIKRKCVSSMFKFAGKSRLVKKSLRFLIKKRSSESVYPQKSPYISNQMRNELEELSNIKYGLKGYSSMQFLDITHESSCRLEQLFDAYSMVARHFDFSSYSYIMILPWLISGGIDLFAINYLNTIANLTPDQHILVFLTNGAHKSFNKTQLGLADNITLIDLPSIFEGDEYFLSLAPELLYSVINIFAPNRLHIMASKAGYDCLIKYGDSVRKNGTKIIFSSYNYLTGQHGEYMGYTVQELPLAYRQGDIVTTDNLASKKLWVDHFGFIADDILIHYQLFDAHRQNVRSVSLKDGVRILWAAHIRPEKNPDILPNIAKSLAPKKIHIDCYGLFTPANWPDGNNPLETSISNLHYIGPYTNFFEDISIDKYTLFLYTSHTDGTPNVVIEAALAGLPIVASRIGGIPDALGNDAILVSDTSSSEQFVQAINTALSDLDSAKKKSAHLQQILAKRYSKTNFIKQVKEMLERSKS